MSAAPLPIVEVEAGPDELERVRVAPFLTYGRKVERDGQGVACAYLSEGLDSILVVRVRGECREREERSLDHAISYCQHVGRRLAT